MHAILICVWIVISLSNEISATICTDAAASDGFSFVTRMCQSGSFVATSLAIDTYDTGSVGYSRCTCEVKLIGGTMTSNTELTVQSYPNTSPDDLCGSTLRISSTTTNGFTDTECNPIPNNTIDNVNSDDTVTLTLSRTDESTAWQSGYCILLMLDQQGTNFFLNVICHEPSSVIASTSTLPSMSLTPVSTSPSMSSTPVSTSPSMSSTPASTSPSMSSTAASTSQSMSSKPTSTSPLMSSTLTSKSLTTFLSLSKTTEDTKSTAQTSYLMTETTLKTHCECPVCLESGSSQNLPIAAVVLPDVLIVLVVAISTVGNIFLYRRRLMMVKEMKYSTHTLAATDPASYESIDPSSIQTPNTYDDLNMPSSQIYENTAN